MKTIDLYRITDELDDETLDVMVLRLESRGEHPRFAAMMNEYLDAMEIDSAESVLDLGCGTGVAARAIAPGRSFRGGLLESTAANILLPRPAASPARKA